MNNVQSNIFPQENGLAISPSRTYNLAIIVCGLLTVIGLAAGLHAMLIGHRVAYGNTREVPWGLLIGTYVFFVVTSTGLCLVSSIGHVFNVEVMKPIAKRSVFLAIITIVSGFLVIAFEIENPWRMPIYNVLSPNITSNIWWMGTLYGMYLLFMVIEFAFLQLERHKIAALFGLSGVVAGIAAHSNLGAVFGLLANRPFWHGPYMPIYFIASAMLSGAAAIIFFSWIAYRANGWQMSETYKRSLRATAKILALLCSILLFFECWKVISGLTGHVPEEYEAMMAIVNGPYSINFWVGEIMLGMVIPFVLIVMSRSKSMKTLFVASAACVIGVFFMRYDLVVVGQIVPQFSGMGIVGQPEYYSYMPTLHEFLVTIGGLAFCCMGFLVGERLFRGHLSEDH